jgi:hypothetical protein
MLGAVLPSHETPPPRPQPRPLAYHLRQWAHTNACARTHAHAFLRYRTYLIVSAVIGCAEMIVTLVMLAHDAHALAWPSQEYSPTDGQLHRTTTV